MKKNIAIVCIVAGVVVGFAGGMFYGKSSATPAAGGPAAFGGGSGRQFTRGAGGAGGAAGAGGGFVGGQIVAEDTTSITVQMPTGGSKIVLVSPSTEIRKSVNGTATDLVNGTQVTVTGTQNSDGSYTATMVQIRPATSTAPAAGQ